MTEDELAGRIDAPAYLAAAELYLDRYDETIAHAERALAVARATGQQFPTLVPTLGSAYLMRGRLVEAIERPRRRHRGGTAREQCTGPRLEAAHPLGVGSRGRGTSTPRSRPRRRPWS